MPVPGEENLTTDASYGLLGLKASTIEQVPQATRDEMRGAGQDYVLSFLGNKAKRPVTAWDKTLERAAIVMAMNWGIMYRGVKPDGRDADIIKAAVAEMTEWLRMIVDPNKSVKPWFQDSSPSYQEMGPIARTARRSDERLMGGCRPPFGPKYRGGCGC